MSDLCGYVGDDIIYKRFMFTDFCCVNLPLTKGFVSRRMGSCSLGTVIPILTCHDRDMRHIHFFMG